jgi:membrane fusion protein, multidrug efflux system
MGLFGRSMSVLLLLSIAACGEPKKPERPPPLVKVERVGMRDFADRYDAVGTATANEQVILTAPVTERVTSLGFSDGDYIRKGQMIAVLAQGQESAALSSAAATAREAEQQLARISALRARGFATNASLEAQIAKAGAARAQSAEARASIADRVIRAPFSGYASLRRISVGAVVGAGTEIATISDTSQIKLDIRIPETLLGAVRVGQPILARAAAFPDIPLSGTVSALDPVVDPVTRSAILRAVLPNADGRIKPGMLLNVKLEFARRNAIAVPELALVRDGEKTYVFTVSKDDTAKRIPVKTGGKDGNLIEVTDGLRPGTAIVTEGVVKLSDGIKLRVADTRSARSPQAH